MTHSADCQGKMPDIIMHKYNNVNRSGKLKDIFSCCQRDFKTFRVVRVLDFLVGLFRRVSEKVLSASSQLVFPRLHLLETQEDFSFRPGNVVPFPHLITWRDELCHEGNILCSHISSKT